MSPEDLKSLRHSLGLSINQFAELVGVEGRTCRRWEDGERPIPKMLEILIELFDLPEVMEYLNLPMEMPSDARVAPTSTR